MGILKDKFKREGLLGTLVFHSLLLVALIFLGFKEVEPPLDEPGGGFLVNLGDGETGLGEEEPAPSQSPVDVQGETVAAYEAPSTPQQLQEKEVLTQEEAAAVAFEKKRKKEEKDAKAEDERKRNEEKQRIEKERLRKEEEARVKKAKSDQLFNGAFNGTGTTGSSQGIAGGSGNQGDPNGVAGAPNYGPGGPGGNGGPGNGGPGYSVSLAGRKMLTKPVITENSQDQGKVVVKIIVDKYGKVTKATAGEKGTTATSSYLKKISEEAAMKTKFDTKTDAAEEQVGTITFTFKLE